VLATIAYATVGLALWMHRRRHHRGDCIVVADRIRLARDQAWFLVIFIGKCALGLVAFAFKPWLGVLFLLAYALYVWRELRDDDTAPIEEILEPLKFQPRRQRPGLTAIWAQVLLALLVIAGASHLFVQQLETIGEALRLPPHLVALLLSPVATELPETMNALIWVRQGKTQLALANISGAMMIQATIPSGLGLLFTPWRFSAPPLLAGIATLLAVTYLLALLRTGRLDPPRLVAAGLFYLAFAVALVALR
jgi:cation:H+ antiporter